VCVWWVCVGCMRGDWMKEAWRRRQK
jgi:hypothetical protein